MMRWRQHNVEWLSLYSGLNNGCHRGQMNSIIIQTRDDLFFQIWWLFGLRIKVCLGARGPALVLMVGKHCILSSCSCRAGLRTIVVQITCKSVWEEKVKVRAGEILRVTTKHHDAGAQKALLLYFTISNLLKGRSLVHFLIEINLKWLKSSMAATHIDWIFLLQRLCFTLECFDYVYVVPFLLMCSFCRADNASQKSHGSSSGGGGYTNGHSGGVSSLS